jgi:hypothetical protein
MESKVEKEDFLYALTQTMHFYNKEVDRMQASFWWTACKDKGVDRLKKALIEHTKVGKFAPKPADILSIVDNMSQQHGRNELPPPPTTNCPPEIAKAWMWFNNALCAGSRNFDGVFASSRVDDELADRYMHIVNHEAHKFDMPDAIPDEYKLKEVWG